MLAWQTGSSRRAARRLEGEAKRKYYEHAGALLTADGTDDNLIKFEGTPSGYQIKLILSVAAATGAARNLSWTLTMVKKPWQGFLEELETLRNHGTLLKSCFLNGCY